MPRSAASSPKNFSKARLLASAICLGVATSFFSSPSFAQETETDQAKKMTTIVITSTKREQTLQDVPVAVSVVANETIERAEISDLIDLQSLVPSFSVVQRDHSAATNFFIRGFGNGALNPGVEPSVGVFIDGVYRSRSAAQISDLPNIERIEVLRGPQSTLFGKNASAGVVSAITRAPQFETGGSAQVSIGNFNTIRVKGDVTGPISDTVAYSLSGGYNSRDGFFDDVVQNTDFNDRNRWGVRGQLQFEPSDKLTFRVIADYDEIDEACCTVANLVTGPVGPVITALGGHVAENAPFARNSSINAESSNEIENSGVSLQADYELNFADLTSITSYRSHDSLIVSDGDFTGAALITGVERTGIDTFTQELRLTSSQEGSMDWMLGAYFFDETVDRHAELIYDAAIRSYVDILTGNALTDIEPIIFGVPAGTFFAQGEELTNTFKLDNQAWSLFATLDFHLSDQLTATLGLNYTADEKQATANSVSTDAFSNLDLIEVWNNVVMAQQLAGAGVDPSDTAAVQAFAAANPGTFTTFQQTAAAMAIDSTANPLYPLIGQGGIQFLPPFLDFPNAVEAGETDDDSLTYTLRLAYDINDSVNIYGTYATGFKASSFNLSPDSRPLASDFIPGSPIANPPSSPIRDAGLALPNLTTGTRFAAPEDATVIEIGLKANFDNVAINLAAFDQKISDFQTEVFLGTGFALSNAGEQSTFGIEADVTWMPIDDLTVIVAATHLDAKYDEFTNSPFGDLSGERPAGIPEWASSVSANYDFEANGWDWFVRGDWQYASEIALFDDPDNQALIEHLSTDFNLINASLGFATQNGLGMTLWGRNIFEEEYVAGGFPSTGQPGSISGYASSPATYGVTLKKAF